MSVIAHTCPNGHEVPVLQPLPCPFCSAGVAYEPCSVGMALADQLRGAVARIAALEAERQAVLDAVNLYGDEILHAALDAIGWPATSRGQ
jgi:hypothetical protein